MDQFLQVINAGLFLEWVSHQDIMGYKKELKKSSITFSKEERIGQYSLYPQSIFEETITDLKTHEITYYMHFQFINFLQAKNMYDEWMMCLGENEETPPLRILLCCSSAMTTSFFASLMNEAALQLHKNCIVDATALSNLCDKAFQYDVLLLAPQVSYELPHIIRDFPEVKVGMLSAKIFGRQRADLALQEAYRIFAEK